MARLFKVLLESAAIFLAANLAFAAQSTPPQPTDTMREPQSTENQKSLRDQHSQMGQSTNENMPQANPELEHRERLPQAETTQPPTTVREPASDTSDDIRGAQNALKDRGYYTGNVNGVMGSQFRQALVDYQRDNNIQAQGELNQETLRSLGIGDTQEREPASAPESPTDQPAPGESDELISPPETPDYIPDPTPYDQNLEE